MAAASAAAKRPTPDGLKVRPPIVELRSAAWFGDLRRTLQLPRPHLPLYRHIVPRSPALLRDHVLASACVQTAIAQASARGKFSAAAIETHARDMLESMGHTLAVNTLRFTAYVMHKAIVQIYEQVSQWCGCCGCCGYCVRQHPLIMGHWQVCSDSATMQQILGLIPKCPVLLLPTHRSYMDFIIISYLFFFSGVPVPAIAAGQDFMNMGPATSLLRGWWVKKK